MTGRRDRSVCISVGCWVSIMAVNLLMPLLIPLGEQIGNVTHLSNVGSLNFAQPWMEVSVKENVAPVLLITLEASTNTSSRTVLYSIVSGGITGLFLLDSHTGELTLTIPLDYEIKNNYEMIVGATAGEEERAFARVVINVVDVNDQPPTFPRPLFETQITEEDDRHLPKSILQVPANDGDVSDKDRLVYSLDVVDELSKNSTFVIASKTGHIHLLRALNRDAPDGRARWHLKVTATDGLHSAEVLVHVNVKDINDNAPFFSSNVINATVMENSDAGTEVIRVRATDYDDPDESTNAVLSYSVEKNVIDEHSGQPIFTIDHQSGILRTARCCLDRERTPSYAIQLVAADGGGLKGTGTVVVVVGDENDVGPRFSRPEWLLTVHETVSLNTTLALLSVEDPDISNDFVFQVVPGSGYGWERFQVVSVGNGSGALVLLTHLDYEDPLQRKGFKFKVKVSDKGAISPFDDGHQSEAWVVVGVVDDNDNNPLFSTPSLNITLPEDASIGSSLAAFIATDSDQGDAGEVHYAIESASDPDRQFVVDSLGVVRLRRPLDRETTSTHTVRVLAVDGGHPSLTATASLKISVTDINDNAPHVARPHGISLQENEGPAHVADLHLGDADSWALGHGPPFKVHLDEDAPDHIKRSFAIFFQDGSMKGGVVTLRSLVALDREASRERLVPLVLSDAEGLTTTATVTVTVADVNDNGMKPAAKTITLRKFNEASGKIPLSRVYVDDPDDWDASQKIWSWSQPQTNHLFSLQERSGRLHVKGNASDGRYLLHFLVSDPTHHQRNVPANVTVTISSLGRDFTNCAVPLIVVSHSPQDLIAIDQHTGISPLESLTTCVSSVAGTEVHLLSLEEKPVKIPHTKKAFGTRIWISAQPSHPLDQLLLLHSFQISKDSGVEVVYVGMESCVSVVLSKEATNAFHKVDGEKEEPVWVVDANVTALVTPRLFAVTEGCDCHGKSKYLHHHHHHHQHHYPRHFQHPTKGNSNATTPEHQPSVAAITHLALCQSNPCLNGGRCIVTSSQPRCVCPAGTSGSICKQLSRYFGGKGWAWVAPIPPKPVVHISLEVRTTRVDCLILYTGPSDRRFGASQQHYHHFQEDVMSLELKNGHPQLLLDLGTGPLLLRPSSNNSNLLADGQWHRIDVFWGHQKAEIVVDLCHSGGGGGGAACRAGVPLPPAEEEGLDVGAPLQVGGVAHPPPQHSVHGWTDPISSTSFLGCIRNLRINGQLRDLGEGVLGEDSRPGCPSADSCSESAQPCSHHARCVEKYEGVEEGANNGGVNTLSRNCECHPGWSSESSCNQRTQPTSFRPKSYIKVALTSTPSTTTTKLQLRFRTWELSSQMLAVTSEQGKDLFTVNLMEGNLCVQLLLHPAPLSRLCLPRILLNDGRWHHVQVQRYGEWMELRVDEGDGDYYNSTQTPTTTQGWLTEFIIDRQEGIHVGGSPEYVGVTLYTVHQDFHHGCLDDIRVNSVNLPLPPLVNTSSAAQATMFTNVQASCPGTPSVCTNISCPKPLVCVDLWRRHQCGCGEGSALSPDGQSCSDVNECLWGPCLNGGTCLNQDPGYKCICRHSYIGEHCEGAALLAPMSFVSPGALAAIISWIFLLIALGIGGWLIHRHRMKTQSKRKNKKRKMKGCLFADEAMALELTSADESLPNTLDITKTTNGEGKMTSKDASAITDVDVLISGGGSGVSQKACNSGHSEKSCGGHLLGKSGKKEEKHGCGCPHLPSVDDLRNYAYEGDGSSPGSLSSCCSGGDKIGDGGFLGGFQDVATLLNCLGGQPDSCSPKHQQENPTSVCVFSSQLQEQAPHVIPPLLSSDICFSSTSSQIFPTNKIHASPDLTIPTTKAKQSLSNLNNRKSIEADKSSKNIMDPNLLSKQDAVKAFHHNSLPRSKANIVFVNNLNGKQQPVLGKTTPVETYHYSLKRNKPSPYPLVKNYLKEGSPQVCYCEHRRSTENVDGRSLTGGAFRTKCVACTGESTASQHGKFVEGIPKRSFSASTVFYLSPSCTCNSIPHCQTMQGQQNFCHHGCPPDGYIPSVNKEGLLPLGTKVSASPSSSSPLGYCPSHSTCQTKIPISLNAKNNTNLNMHVMADLYNSGRI